MEKSMRERVELEIVKLFNQCRTEPIYDHHMMIRIIPDQDTQELSLYLNSFAIGNIECLNDPLAVPEDYFTFNNPIKEYTNHAPTMLYKYKVGELTDGVQSKKIISWLNDLDNILYSKISDKFGNPINTIERVLYDQVIEEMRRKIRGLEDW
jgi:hypothetical protein